MVLFNSRQFNQMERAKIAWSKSLWAIRIVLLKMNSLKSLSYRLLMSSKLHLCSRKSRKGRVSRLMKFKTKKFKDKAS